MKNIILSVSILIASIAGLSAQSTATNIQVEVRVMLQNGQTRTNINNLKNGEIVTVNALVDAHNADTNNATITSQKFVANLIDERIARMRLAWLRDRQAALQAKINKITVDVDLDTVSTAVDAVVPQ